jgi:uncharacterized heparinase superfamily protein
MSEVVSIVQNVAQQAITRASGNFWHALRARLPHSKSAIPTRILLAPDCLMPGDADRPKAFYRGCFELAGERVELGARTPFAHKSASPAWQASLNSFTWLADLAAAGNALPRAQARTLISEWIAMHGRKADPQWALPVLSARLTSWLRYSPFFMENAGEEFHRTLMVSIGRQMRHLSMRLARTPRATERLTGAIAFAYCIVCLEGLDKYSERSMEYLSRELDRQILPDGGHCSRNPEMLLEFLLDLIPLRDAFEERQIEHPDSLLIALDRAVPFLATMTHGDGGLAFFNGVSGGRRKSLARLFARTRSARTPLTNARHAGYIRLSQGDTTAIMDTGQPSAPGLGGAGHAGALSFELSHGGNRVVVNCGHCGDGPPEWREATCGTAAHSALSVNDRSSGQVLTHRWIERLAGGPVVIGPANIHAQSETSADGSLMSARHDGFVKPFGLVHQREIYIAASGGDVRGEDRIFDATDRADARAPNSFTTRFHLHPSVKATLSQDGQSVLAMLPSKSGWRFSAKGAVATLEESVYFDERNVPLRTQQIVLSGTVDRASTVKWAFKLMDTSTANREERANMATLPLSGGGMNQS